MKIFILFQLYHICQTDGRRNSFLCPVGTLFNQKVLVCDWWYNTDCFSSDNYFDRNAYLYQESINANNYKGHHQPNAVHTNKRSARNFGGTEFSDTYGITRADQNLNHFNGNPNTRSGNLDSSNERNAGNYKKNNWEDVMNDFSRVKNTEYVSEGNVALPNNKYIYSGNSDIYKIERMDQSINPFNDVSETRIEKLDLTNERRDNNKENDWDDITNDFSSELTAKHAPERHTVFSNDKYLPSEENIDDKRTESLSLEEKGIDRSSGKNFDSWGRRDINSFLEGESPGGPFDENIFRSKEKREYKENRYGVSDRSIDRLDEVVQKEKIHSDNEAINKVLDKSVTLQGNYVKQEVNSLSSEESVKNNKETNSSPVYESPYFGENEEMRQEEENNHGEVIHTKFQTNTPIQGNTFKAENNLLISGRSVEKDKDTHRKSAQLEEIGVEEGEEGFEKYDEKRGALEKDIISEEDDPESAEDGNDKEVHSSPILLNPILTQDEHTSEENVFVNDRILGTTSASQNAEIPSNVKKDSNSNQIESDKNRRTDEKEGNSYASSIGVEDQKSDAEQRKSVVRNLETIDTSEITKPKSELDENKYSVKESGRKYKDIVGENERTEDGSTEEESEMEEFGAGDIVSKTMSLGDEIRDTLTDITSGDRLYRDILISEVISPHYRNTIRQDEQRSHSLENINRNSDKQKNHMSQADGKLDSLESSTIMRTEDNHSRNYKINKDFSDLILDTAESRLQENIRKPFEKTFIEEETHGKKYRRISLRQPGNSTRMSRSRFNDTSRKRQLLRKIRHK